MSGTPPLFGPVLEQRLCHFHFPFGTGVYACRRERPRPVLVRFARARTIEVHNPVRRLVCNIFNGVRLD